MNENIIKKINEIYHNQEAKFYDTFHSKIIEQEKENWERAKRYFQTPRQMTVLDIGAGTGFVAFLVASWLKEDDVVICNDLSREMLRLVQEKIDSHKLKPFFKFLKAAADRTDLPSESIDIITLNSVLHHLPNIGNFFKEAVRILKRGGVMIITHEPNRRYYSNNFLILLNRTANKFYSLIRRLFRFFLNKESKIDKDRALLYEAVGNLVFCQGITSKKLSAEEISKIVDFHSPTAGSLVDKNKGFDCTSLFARLKTDWIVEEFFTYAHLGKRSYSRTIFVKMIEFVLKKFFPQDGASFSLIMRKR